MTGSPIGGALRQIHHLFVEGTVAGLPDGQLLERFLARGDEAAFAALVRAARADGPGHLPLGPPQPRRRRGRLPGHVPGPGLQGTVDPGPGDASAAGCARSPIASPSRPGPMPSAGAPASERAGARRDDERRNAEPPDDWRQVLHEELARLSEKYRLPLLLCDLEGKTHAQAAAELGCGPATVQRRLNGARELAPLATDPARDRTDGRDARRDPRPLGRRAGPPGWVEATVRAAAVVRLARRPARGRRRGVRPRPRPWPASPCAP